MAATKYKKKHKHKRPAKARVREHTARNLWTARARPARYGREQFRFRVSRGKRRLPTIDIDPWVENANWERANGVRSGELTFRQPLAAHTATMITYGDILHCQWSPFDHQGPWRELWRMKIATPSHQIQGGIVALSVASELDVLSKSRVGWKFRTDKNHPHGWTADQITRNVCQRFHVPLDALPQGKYLIKKHVPKSASPIAVLAWAWREENRHTGRRFDIDVSSGAVKITELHEPRFALIVGASMLDATVGENLINLASAVIAHATHKVKGHKKAEKFRVKLVDPARERRYGYIVKTLHAPSSMKSAAELRDWAKRRLAKMFGHHKSLSFTHPGMPLVDTGTPLLAHLPEADLHQVVFVTSARHDLSAGSYTMDVTVGFDDPFALDQRKARAQRKKDAAAAKRHRKTAGKSKSPAPAKAASRSNG